jgi:hypothetical protein
VTPFWPTRQTVRADYRAFPLAPDDRPNPTRDTAHTAGLHPRVGAAPATPRGRGNLAIPAAVFAVTLILLRRWWR